MAERHFADVFAGLFAVAALALAVFAGVTDSTPETTVYCAVAAFVFALLTVGTYAQAASMRRRAAAKRASQARR